MTFEAPVWMDGRWLEAGEAHVSVRDRNFLLGDGCFETLRYADGQIEGVDAHLGFLRRSASVLDIKLSHSEAALATALDELADRLREAGAGETAVRVTVSRGAGGRGADVSDAAPFTVIDASPTLPRASLSPLRVVTSAIRRNEFSPLSRIKSTSYGDNLAARRDAVASGADEALMLNTQGRVACLAMANLVLLDKANRSLVTPSEEEGARPGYMRSTVLEQARSAGWSVEERGVEPEELIKDGVALLGTNSLWGVRPITEMDGRRRPETSPPAFLSSDEIR